MKTWDDWSDEAIDVKVTRIVFGCSGWAVTSDANKLCRFDENNRLLYTQEVIKYCNSWANIGQILLDKGIGMVAENGKLIGATTSSQQYYEPYGDTIYSHDHVNPLRAAAIVFLMMNGVNPE